MPKYFFILLTAFIGVQSLKAQELKAYQIYNKQQEKVDFTQMMEALSTYDIVLFGEYHNNAILHWLQLKTTKALFTIKKGDLVLGAEMFERDNQAEIEAYLSGEISAEQFQDSARLWKNFKTDYKPLLDFAKENNLKFVATNVPRRYAKIVSHYSLDSLSKLSIIEKSYLAELPIKVDMKTPGYSEMKAIFEKHDMGEEKIMNFIDAQALKDATMAASILKNHQRKQLFLHYNGDYHSKAYGGIYWYLKKKKAWLKNLKVAVISVHKSKVPELVFPVEEVVPTEFIIVVPSDMTKTY